MSLLWSSPIGWAMSVLTVVSLIWVGLTVRRYALSYWFDGAIAAVSGLIALSALGHGLTFIVGIDAVANAPQGSKGALIATVVEQGNASLLLGVGLSVVLGVWAMLWSAFSKDEVVTGGALRLRAVGAAVVVLASVIALVMAISSHVSFHLTSASVTPSTVTAFLSSIYLTVIAALVALGANVVFTPVRLAALAVSSNAPSDGGDAPVENPFGVGSARS